VANYIVTLDGPAGVGKSSVAKLLAGALGIAYLDTGAMYRALAFALGEGAWELPGGALQERLGGFEFSLHGSGADSYLKMNGRAVGEEIRSEEVGMWASNVAVLPAVRAFLTIAQVRIGMDTALVAEGRDMGTVVFPGARFKFFLDADVEERARRRHEQLLAAGEEVDLAELTEQIARRDHQDRTRAVAPLKPAQDAEVVDTTSLTLEQVYEHLLEKVRAGL